MVAAGQRVDGGPRERQARGDDTELLGGEGAKFPSGAPELHGGLPISSSSIPLPLLAYRPADVQVPPGSERKRERGTWARLGRGAGLGGRGAHRRT